MKMKIAMNIMLFSLVTNIFGTDKPFTLEVKSVNNTQIDVKITPAFPLPGRLYSLSFVDTDKKVVFPVVSEHSQKEKDANIMLILEEKSNTLQLPLYKEGVQKINKKIVRTQTFCEPFITNTDGKTIGTRAEGVIFFMKDKVGMGVVQTANGEGVVPLADDGSYTVRISFCPHAGVFKILAGIIHVDLVNPGLVFPILSSSFTIK